MAIQAVEQFYPYLVEDAGVTYNVQFVTRVRYDDGTRHWFYFGVTESELPRAQIEPNVPELQTAPFTEYADVKFPGAFQDLPDEQYHMIAQLALYAGMNREGESIV